MQILLVKILIFRTNLKTSFSIQVPGSTWEVKRPETFLILVFKELKMTELRSINLSVKFPYRTSPLTHEYLFTFCNSFQLFCEAFLIFDMMSLSESRFTCSSAFFSSFYSLLYFWLLTFYLIIPSATEKKVKLRKVSDDSVPASNSDF